jgi:predicted transcriptional regulator
VGKRLSAIQTRAVICTELEQGVPEEKIKENLELEDKTFSFYVEFAFENKWLIKAEKGKYQTTTTGKEFIRSVLS